MIVNGNNLIADIGKILVRNGNVIGNALMLGCEDNVNNYSEVSIDEITEEEKGTTESL